MDSNNNVLQSISNLVGEARPRNELDHARDNKEQSFNRKHSSISMNHTRTREIRFHGNSSGSNSFRWAYQTLTYRIWKRSLYPCGSGGLCTGDTRLMAGLRATAGTLSGPVNVSIGRPHLTLKHHPGNLCTCRRTQTSCLRPRRINSDIYFWDHLPNESLEMSSWLTLDRQVFGIFVLKKCARSLKVVVRRVVQINKEAVGNAVEEGKKFTILFVRELEVST